MRSGNTAALAKVHVKGAEANRAAADAFARNVLPIIRQIQASGVRSYRAIAGALNARGYSDRPRWSLARQHGAQCAQARAMTFGPRYCACCGSGDGVPP